ncbi:uncharacterized protein MONOS_11897 [Monocercomonoides exilis]|uniref:uncharacterized protein n=1 Tax=Monocercomonoides exilis TaxID=2049356 RepID=UPI00355A74B8|nr:hypothetical protein MONOS_11897 [Monocercomonoides exilis]|eukprot:MONOS_11897.1-p1 / transcript=MONOS_11897.1 / gene=MONOS_11897 / organism=Monocercomonoides_exilis_PA203 / gene_product=unspecified product / transcript_product=unspecified product / location=Mono_scaffold00622:31210-31884(+) / protein_length=225 / sequence_SO=supercontig / SO=protein_coding / is_pseudo=false
MDGVFIDNRGLIRDLSKFPESASSEHYYQQDALDGELEELVFIIWRVLKVIMESQSWFPHLREWFSSNLTSGERPKWRMKKRTSPFHSTITNLRKEGDNRASGRQTRIRNTTTAEVRKALNSIFYPVLEFLWEISELKPGPVSSEKFEPEAEQLTSCFFHAVPCCHLDSHRFSASSHALVPPSFTLVYNQFCSTIMYFPGWRDVLVLRRPSPGISLSFESFHRI